MRVRLCEQKSGSSGRSPSRLEALCRQNLRSARRQFVMKPHGGRIKLAQGYRITKIVKKESRLMRDAIEGKRFDAQTRFFRRAVTSRFGGAQFVITPWPGIVEIILRRMLNLHQ